MFNKDLSELVKDVKDQKITATQLVEESLAQIEKQKDLNAVITINNQALDQAKKIDQDIASGKEVGRLAGIPYIAKDNYLSEGLLTTAASNILGNFIPPYSATVIKKLQDEGAILVAKANLDSFAHGSSTENSDFGPSLNPHDKTRVPGGSSGGSAVAVAAGMTPFSLGSDTGGSIRLPASFTGTVGYKPTYGLVSRYGVVAMASSTDVMGPITNTVADSAYVMDVIAGQDPKDSTTIESEKDFQIKAQELKGQKIGLVKQYVSKGVDKPVKEAVFDVVDKLKAAGALVEEVDLPILDLALAVYYIVMPAEVSSNLSRYDGIRYGFSDEQAKDLEGTYYQSRTQGFNDEVKRRIMLGTYVLSSGYYDAYYKRAQQVRSKLIQSFEDTFGSYDILIGPTSPTTAFKLGQNTKDPLKMYLTDIMTVAANLVGNPAISIPIAKEGKLPIGLQLMGKQTADRQLLNVAAAVEGLVEYR